MEVFTAFQPLLTALLSALAGLLGVYVGSRLVTTSQARLARLDWEHQLRMAALEKRLEKHQEAFSLWWRLLGALHTGDLKQRVIECQTWWAGNCVFLSPEIAGRFVQTYRAADNHADLLAIWKSNGRVEDSQKVRDNFDIIRDLGPRIEAAVALPNVTPHVLPEGVTAFGDA